MANIPLYLPGEVERIKAQLRGKNPGFLGRLAGAAKAGGKMAVVGGAATLGSLGLLALLKAKEHAHERVTRGGDFQKMLKEAPSLQEKKDEAHKHFMTLRRLAPDIAREPVLAAGFTKKMMAYQNEGVDPTIVHQLFLRKNPTDATKVWEVAARSIPSVSGKVDLGSV
jgi:hypothetical protein